MDPKNVEAIPTYTKVHRLHPIEEDDLEAIESMAGLANQSPLEEKSKEHLEEGTNGQSQVSALPAAVHSSRSIVASMKKVISSLGPNAASSVQDFIHINDCFTEKSDKSPDQTEAFVSDLNIHLVMVRGGAPDPQLQGELRNRLRLLENDNKEVASVFCELSARLLSIESDKDLITVTFRTLEEIWKFSTYYSLGFLNHCMENIFLDQSFWLTSPEEEDPGIQVLLSDASLSLIYKNLLMEEGMYFVLCSDNSVQQAVVVDGTVQIMQSSAADDPSTAWTETDPSMSDDRTLSPRTITEPLCPFHQWFLKTNSASDLMGLSNSGPGNQIVSTGWVEAIVNHEGEAPDEISYQNGDMIEIVTTYIECMEWFVGRNLTTGSVGFVQASNMKPFMPDKGQKSTSFPIDERELSRDSPEEDLDFKEAKILLQNISQSDVCHSYKLDQFKETEICPKKGQLRAIQLLCHFYNTLEVNEAQCIIYNEYQLSLAKKMSDKVLEGQVLETISQLYLSLGTERACRSALEYTKRSLGIFIDLQSKEREAYAWLMAGKIYYILGQNELVDLYIQVAQNVALCTGDPQLGMKLYEASGDIFFNGASDRNKATTFYRDCALPLAVKTENETAELRLCNKLAELLMSTKNYEEALEHAKMALALSVNLGNALNERVSYHRLAGIYSHLNQSELAEHFYLKALSLCSSPLQLEEESVYYMKVYLVLGDIIFYDLKDPYDAAGYYHLALAAAMDLGNKKSQLKIYTRLAVIYHNFLVDREKSLYFYQKARTFATELNVRRINLSPGQQYQSLARTYSC